MDDRALAISLLREWGRQQCQNGRQVGQVHRELLSACTAVLDSFRTEFDVPGVRYWEICPAPGEHANCWTTSIGRVGMPALWTASEGGAVELNRIEYLSRSHQMEHDDPL